MEAVFQSHNRWPNMIFNSVQYPPTEEENIESAMTRVSIETHVRVNRFGKYYLVHVSDKQELYSLNKVVDTQRFIERFAHTCKMVELMWRKPDTDVSLGESWYPDSSHLSNDEEYLLNFRKL